MTIDSENVLPKQIQDSFQRAASRLPAYEQILPFFKTLFVLQEEAVHSTWPDVIPITPELMQAKLDGEFPLMDRHHAPMDQPAAISLLKALLSEAEKTNPKMRDAAATISAIVEGAGDDIEHGFDLVMAGDQEGVKRLGEKIGVDQEMLTFFLYNSLFPSIAQHARQLSEQHDINANWGKGNCPICGGRPNLSYLSDSGQRFLVCHFCRHQWPIRRILCPHCGGSDADTIGYFFVEEEKAYRVYTCDACKTYIKTVDTRELSHAFYPPLENIITTHLDLHALELGYQSEIENL